MSTERLLNHMDQKERGREGEDLAAGFLERSGYQIVERNYRKHFGEIDLVARDGETLCFVEVKARVHDYYGHPFEAVTRAKQRVIRKLAAVYLAEQEIQDQFVRFDVVGISYPEGEDPLIELLKDAF